MEQAKTAGPRIRVAHGSHEWTPLYLEKSSWMMKTGLCLVSMKIFPI